MLSRQIEQMNLMTTKSYKDMAQYASGGSPLALNFLSLRQYPHPQFLSIGTQTVAAEVCSHTNARAVY